MTSGGTGPFAVGDKVLVPHVEKFYEAKIQKAQKRDDGMWYYFLHYLGWNKKWDEWVEETGLRKPGGATAASAPPIGSAGTSAGPAGAAAAAAGAGGGGGSAAAGPSSGGGASKKRKGGSGGAASGGAAAAASGDGLAAAAAGPGLGAADSPLDPAALQIELPPALQQQLLVQYDAIHDSEQLTVLPRRPNVLQVFEQYVKYVRDKTGGESEQEEALVSGLQVYFDKALYQCLLYKAERRQADAVLASGEVPAAIYGAEHLLRLIIKMPELLPQASVAPEALGQLVRRLEDLLTFLQHQAGRLFLTAGEYVSAASYYAQLAAERQQAADAVAGDAAAAAAAAATGAAAGKQAGEEARPKPEAAADAPAAAIAAVSAAVEKAGGWGGMEE